VCRLCRCRGYLPRCLLYCVLAEGVLPRHSPIGRYHRSGGSREVALRGKPEVGSVS
jgi:hypothetical protein